MNDRIAKFAYNGLFYGNAAHICRSCGCGSMTSGDGFLVSRCLNCNVYDVDIYGSKAQPSFFANWSKRIAAAVNDLFQPRKKTETKLQNIRCRL